MTIKSKKRKTVGLKYGNAHNGAMEPLIRANDSLATFRWWAQPLSFLISPLKLDLNNFGLENKASN